MSRPYTSANRFAALDSLPIERTPVQRQTKPANGHAHVNGKAQSNPTVVNGKANPGKASKDRTSTSSIQDVPSMESTTTKRSAKKQKTRAVAKATPTPAAAVPVKVDWEVPRKTLHASIGFLVLYLYGNRPPSVWPLIRGLAATGALIYLVDLVRLRSPAFARTYNAVLGPLMRESEKTSVNGVVWYLIGVTWTLAVYPRDIAVIAILTLSWSDTAASTIGRLIGPLSPSLPSHVPLIPALPFAARKSLAGYLAAALTGSLICLGFWWNGRHAGWQPHAGDAGWWFLDFAGVERGNGFGRMALLGKPLGLWLSALVLGFGGATVEAIDLNLDDNMTLPIGTGALMWAWLSIAKYIL
ncbi:hypothetical protein NliqN6_5193 [Naganishia liquefaciens]|uniref:Phosphatidate cytidylyltransferase n=1 Tax=Naganishia liquefaciens TaxID=104408 RepID=A0A8H3TXM6_9TREE|nr:hypothetical protein NliqN6_5193 [Naganishia liquefaciens]